MDKNKARRLANKFVRQKEQEHLNEMREHEEIMHKKASPDSCNCFQCQRGAKSATEARQREERRLNRKPHMDHEEEILMQKALRRFEDFDDGDTR